MAGWGGGFATDNPNVKNLVIRNNIFGQNLTFQMAEDANLSAANLVVDHNLIYPFRDGEGEIRGTDSVEADPLFVDTAAADFNLGEGSPAIDSGSTSGAPDVDFEGNSRPVDGNGDNVAAPDMGAYEYSPSTDLVYLPIMLTS